LRIRWLSVARVFGAQAGLPNADQHELLRLARRELERLRRIHTGIPDNQCARNRHVTTRIGDGECHLLFCGRETLTTDHDQRLRACRSTLRA
jgi:hypothetical protein